MKKDNETNQNIGFLEKLKTISGVAGRSPLLAATALIGTAAITLVQAITNVFATSSTEEEAAPSTSESSFGECIIEIAAQANPGDSINLIQQISGDTGAAAFAEGCLYDTGAYSATTEENHDAITAESMLDFFALHGESGPF